MSKQEHVVTNPNGGWDVKSDNSSKASEHFDGQQEAIAYAQIVAKNQNAELFIHGKDGKIKRRWSYGTDPFPPKG
ncbi:hypothetical protein B808_1115 [Fructilactobacillus florum 8D]|uniref:DUF2188 domain-containing protein n=1 Tax=Fructilactobacillus florum 8D TaxID=1221538 RepID=W9EFH7_9LACO|nr:DUF2188 domain-containing protein [Fructilactobacillus florum]ETO40006.1 hypothetical protein B808_1115 [Fructilactobacillus florum 8D]